MIAISKAANFPSSANEDRDAKCDVGGVVPVDVIDASSRGINVEPKSPQHDSHEAPTVSFSAATPRYRASRFVADGFPIFPGFFFSRLEIQLLFFFYLILLLNVSFIV